MSAIQLPTIDEIPPEYRPEKRVVVKPRLLKVRSEDLPNPIGFRILVLPVTIPTQTESGVQLPLDAIRHMHLSRRVGVVLKIGKLAFSQERGFPADYEPEVSEGDWVNFHEHAGTDITMNGPEGLVNLKYLTEPDILGKIRNPEAFMVVV